MMGRNGAEARLVTHVTGQCATKADNHPLWLRPYRRDGMTEERIAALDALIEAVEAGHEGTALMRAMPDGTSYEHTGLIYSAAKGSFDAALELKVALLPGWYWGRDDDGLMRVWQPDAADPYGFCSDDHQNPARDFLSAILHAYRSTLTPPTP